MPRTIPDGSISDEAPTRTGLDTPTSPPPESPRGPHGNNQNTAVVGNFPDAVVESSPVGSSIGTEVANDTPDPPHSRQLRKKKPKATSVSRKRASDAGDLFKQMSETVQKRRLAAVKKLEQAWSKKQDEWLPKLLWAAELRVDGDSDQLKPARDWHTGVLVKLSEVSELTSRDLVSAHNYLQEAGQHHGLSWDEEPNAAGITVHKLLELLERAHRLAVRAQSSELSTTPNPEQERTARTRRGIGSLACKGLECSDVDDEEPPMLPRQAFKRELSEGSQGSIVVTGTGPNKRLRADSQPGPQPEVQPEAQREPPTNAVDRTRLELEEAIGAAELAAARFDMLEKKDRVQRLKLQLRS
ncbi:hypothetical protein KC318_g6976 [Hortaea werneckii]|nr:hypothetical protein KC334_g6641 [Hortaea werneckii]KAI7011921.1 hypothetical protein KC355_g5610 [Hortaea werneckii]KAI7198299.1 hypothetical protein KC324_g3867 [Hortaea werneckii]KAI7587740.1 hypothetical protein KC316_g4869 [Hortaea werneckii]KAI7665663.1 hypothetical protein KC318_g6976 [Hortaea werneckii]